MIPICYLFLVLADGPLTADQSIFEAPETKAGKPLVHAFLLRNNGTTPIALAKPVTTCGCQTPFLAKTTLRPGEGTELKLAVTTITQASGPNQWKITVPFNDGKSDQSLDLFLKTFIVREIEVQPVQLAANFEGAFQGTITVHDKRGKPLKVTGVSTSIQGLTTSVAVVDGKQVVTLKLPETAAPGDRTDNIVLKTDNLDYPELRVPVSLSKRPKGLYTVTPESLLVRPATEKPVATGMIVLRPKGDKPVEIDRVESDSPDVVLKFANANHACAVRVVWTNPRKDDPAEPATAIIHLKEPAGQVVRVPIRWETP